jgi:molybdopterin-biosynthesis enzyme MoeA-like protein
MGAGVVSIGSEFLLGQSVDTGPACITSHLAAIGSDRFHQRHRRLHPGDCLSPMTVPGGVDVVITTGGPGSPAANMTREVARAVTRLNRLRRPPAIGSA